MFLKPHKLKMRDLLPSLPFPLIWTNMRNNFSVGKEVTLYSSLYWSFKVKLVKNI